MAGDRNTRRAVSMLLAAATVLVCCEARPALAAPDDALPEMLTADDVERIERGLNYLAETQRANGSWHNQGGYGSYPTAMTSLAGLALMAEGSTPESGRYARNVARAMEYVLWVAETYGGEDGLISGPGSESRSMYGHGFGMLFLAQCYGTEIDAETERRIRTALHKAVALTAASQSDLGPVYGHAGGWIYTPTGGGDEGSVTVTQLQALRACRNAGIEVPSSTIARAVRYLRVCQNPDGGIAYSFRNRGSASRPPISAAAIACFYAAGVYDRQIAGATADGDGEVEMVERLVDYAREHVTVEAGPQQMYNHFFYGHFYMAQAMYQRGGEDWRRYFPRIRDALLAESGPQAQAADGSWQGDAVGTTYGTALATIILQLPYGYLPIYQR